MKLWDALDLGSVCDVDDANAGEVTLVWPCGLRIKKEEAQSEIHPVSTAVVHNAHFNHHHQNHPERDWKLIVSVLEVSMSPGAPFEDRATASCDCKIVKEVEEAMAGA
tara:strand:- start:91 stop:414 length:324 start_codon:yes stop_codon:yes gene_type:complete